VVGEVHPDTDIVVRLTGVFQKTNCQVCGVEFYADTYWHLCRRMSIDSVCSACRSQEALW
jgi:vancomycin permeability regulator SanA